MSSRYEVNVFKLIYLQNLLRIHTISSLPSHLQCCHKYMSVGESLGSHSLHSFAEFL